MRIEAVAGQIQVLYARRIFIALGIAGVFVFGIGGTESILILAAALLSAFLGITNFGRQCPLLLFIRSKMHRP